MTHTFDREHAMTTATKQPTLTVDQVMEFGTWKNHYPRDRVEQLWAGRDALTAREIAALDIAPKDRLSALLRLDVPYRLLYVFACDTSSCAIAAKRRWIAGDATDAELREVRDMAWDAALDAAWNASAAGDAAWNAAWERMLPHYVELVEREYAVSAPEAGQ